MFPANVYAARKGIPFRGRPPTPLPVRALLQLAFIVAVWWTAIPIGRKGTLEDDLLSSVRIKE